MDRPRIAHQPALDGVRAVSVLAVLLFHAEVPGLDGGYLGVSVFFTLSGFLITTLLIAEHTRAHRIDVPAFYVRRAKRLLPASVGCVVVLAVLAATTDLFAGVANLERDLLGALFQVANWVFLAGDGSYQELFADVAGQRSPVEHYWSLAIEEQFYWLWPLAFLAIWRAGRTHAGRTRLVAVLTVLFAAAAPLIAELWGPDAAYWATPARIAEILVGCLAAFVVADRELSPRWHLVAAAALAALVLAFVVFPASGGPAYRGALPLVGAVSALLIVGLQVPGPVRSTLSLAPFAWLGRISYGVYLFHWPVFVVIDAPRYDLSTGALFVVRMAVTLVLAQASFSFFERPIRNGTFRAGHVGLGALAATATAAVAVAVVVPAGTGEYWNGDQVEAAAIDPVADGTLAPLVVGATAPPSASTPPASSNPESSNPASSNPASSNPASSDTSRSDTSADGDPDASDASDASRPATTSTLAPLPVPSRPVRIVVAGDSTAEATGAGLAQWAIERPELAQVSVLAEQGCGFVRGGEYLVQDWVRPGERCDRWLDEGLVDDVARLQPDVVMLLTTSWDVLDRRWSGDRVVTPLDAEYQDQILFGFQAVTDRLLGAGAGRVVWVREPIPNVFWWSSGQAQEQPERHAVLYRTMDLVAERSGGRVDVVDLPGWLVAQGLDDDQDARPDGVHWSPEASARIARDFLGEQLVRAALGLLPQA